MINLIIGGVLTCFAVLHVLRADNTLATSSEVSFFGYAILAYIVLGDV